MGMANDTIHLPPPKQALANMPTKHPSLKARSNGHDSWWQSMIVLTIIHYHWLSCLRSNGPWWFVEIAQCASVASEDLFRYRSNSFPDIKLQSSIVSSYIPIGVVIAKNLPQTWLGLVLVYYVAYQTTTPLLVAWVFRFFPVSHFLAFSVTVVRIFVQIIALLFFTGRWQCGSHCIEPALVSPADRKTIVHYHPLGQTKKIIMNYHVEFEHVQTVW